jgi:hypothetical protein
MAKPELCEGCGHLSHNKLTAEREITTPGYAVARDDKL